MNTHPWLLVAAAMAPLALAACTVTPSDPTGTGGSTSTTSTTSTSTTSTSTTTSGAGGGDCAGVFPGATCATCGQASCCAEGAACDATAGCIACVYSSDQACTDANKAVAGALVDCMHASCEAACFPPEPPVVDVTCTVPAPGPLAGACVTVGGPIKCNPITNALCDGASGEACDFDSANKGYKCYPGPNDRSLCATCGPTNGAGQCKAGSTCLPGPDGKCGKFCCDSAECGAGKCDKSAALPGGVGYCIGGNP